MKIQPAIKQETLHIALGVLMLSGVMNRVFLLFQKWTLGVLWGTLLGAGWAVCNFFLLGISVQQMAAEPSEKRGKLKLQLSYSLRMLGTLAVVVIAVKFKCFVWLAAVLPLFFPRITILIMQMLGLYKPDKTKKEDEPI